MALNWAEKIKNYLFNIWFLWLLCLILNIITFLLIFFKIHGGPKTLALHYNVLVGVEWYGKGENLYFIPTVGLALCGANLVLYRQLKGDQNFLSELTVFVSLFVQLILLVASIFLININ